MKENEKKYKKEDFEIGKYYEIMLSSEFIDNETDIKIVSKVVGITDKWVGFEDIWVPNGFEYIKSTLWEYYFSDIDQGKSAVMGFIEIDDSKVYRYLI